MIPNLALPAAGEPVRNRILLALPPRERDLVLSHAVEVGLHRGQVLYRAGDPVEQFYFLNRGLVCLVVGNLLGRMLETIATYP